MIRKKMKGWRGELFTIPNLMSYFRILLVPVFCVLYLRSKYILSTVVLAVSGITDVADGIVARKCNMVTDWGRVIDPVADKFTQIAIAFCVMLRFRWVIPVFILLLVKESFMLVMGLVILKGDYKIESSMWFGKLSTSSFYVLMGLLVLMPDMPPVLVKIFSAVCAALLMLSLIGYLIYDIRKIRKENKLRAEEGENI